jgi:8-oxo-dGTP pyrophosphatase MutT (NUDIX family)
MSFPSPASALDLLRAHLATAIGPGEASMAADAVAFIGLHPDCLLRSCAPGHLTGSAWVVNADHSRVLLTLHRKLGRWLNPGGHADGDPDLPSVGLREAREETGLAGVRLVSRALFDFDRHWIPERPGTPGHFHYDFRFLCEADDGEPLEISEESVDLAWVDRSRVLDLNPAESMRRLVLKSGAIASRRPGPGGA